MEFKGVEGGDRKRGTLGGETRRAKSLRIGVHHANGVVWGPVYRTRLNRAALTALACPTRSRACANDGGPGGRSGAGGGGGGGGGEEEEGAAARGGGGAGWSAGGGGAVAIASVLRRMRAPGATIQLTSCRSSSC